MKMIRMQVDGLANIALAYHEMLAGTLAKRPDGGQAHVGAGMRGDEVFERYCCEYPRVVWWQDTDGEQRIIGERN